MKKLILCSISLIFFSSTSFAICIPSNLFSRVFLGLSADETQYAIGHFDRVLKHGYKGEKDTHDSKICFYNVKDNKQIKCETKDLKITEIKAFRRDIKKIFAKDFKDWGFTKLEYSHGRLDSTLDCRGTSHEDPKCIIEISEYVGELERKFYLKTFHHLSSHKDPSPRLKTEYNGVYEGKNKKSLCYQYSLSHSSANCESGEDLIYCAILP